MSPACDTTLAGRPGAWPPAPPLSEDQLSVPLSPARRTRQRHCPRASTRPRPRLCQRLVDHEQRYAWSVPSPTTTTLRLRRRSFRLLRCGDGARRSDLGDVLIVIVEHLPQNLVGV